MIEMSDREEKIRNIRILLAKARNLVGEQQELRQKFVEAYIKGQKDKGWLSEKRGDFRIRMQDLENALINVIISIAKEARGLEEVRINLQDFDIIDQRTEGQV